MANKIQTKIGIEYTPTVLRAVYLQGTPGNWSVKGFREQGGDFTKALIYAETLKEMRRELGFSSTDPISVSIAGKQVYVVQIPFKKIPDSEMKNALRFEIRQNLPFESGNATIHYQWVGDDQVLVVVVGHTAYQHQVDGMREAGLNLQNLEVLPLVLANSIELHNTEVKPNVAQICLHFGEENCSLIMDGESAPFYSRTIQFRASKLSGNADQALPPAEISGALELLGSELRRSLNFYEKNYESKGFGNIILSGCCASEPRILSTIKEHVGLPINSVNLKSLLHNAENIPDYEFEVAMIVALGGAKQ